MAFHLKLTLTYKFVCCSISLKLQSSHEPTFLYKYPLPKNQAKPVVVRNKTFLNIYFYFYVFNFLSLLVYTTKKTNSKYLLTAFHSPIVHFGLRYITRPYF